MELVIPDATEAEAGLRAVKTVLTCCAPLNPIEVRMLGAVQRHVLRRSFDLEALSVIEPGELARRVQRPAVRRQIVDGMIVSAFASGDAHEQQAALIEGFAAALGVERPATGELRRLIRRQAARLRFDVLRRMYIGEQIATIWHDRGVRGILELLGGFKGWREQPELAARYRALVDLPRGTLGREYYEHCRGVGFALPGERYAGPELMAIHDMAHVLGGYGTDPEGELQVAAFTAGFRREQSLHIMLFVLCQFDLGVAMVPVAEPELGLLDPEKFFAALLRGKAMTVDLFDGWDYWEVMGEEVEVLRERYGIAAA